MSLGDPLPPRPRPLWQDFALRRRVLAHHLSIGVRRLFHLRAALQRAAADAGVRARVRGLAGAGQPVAVDDDRDARRRDDRRAAPSPTSSDASASWSRLSWPLPSPPCSPRWRQNWPTLLGLRALAGLALSGLPAVAMAYSSHEMDAQAIGLAMGLYIAGSTLGGMSGRLVVAALSDHCGWRPAIAAAGAVGLIGAALIGFALPASRRFSPRWPDFAGLAALIRRHMADPGLCLLFAEGFLLMGSFVCAYNYTGFRLASAPFSLSQDRHRLHLRALSRRRGQFDGDGRSRRPLRAPARAGGRHRHRGGGRRRDAAGQPGRRHRRRRPDHLGISSAPIRSLRAGSACAPRRRARRPRALLFLYYLGSSPVGSPGGCSLRAPAGPASPGCWRR